MFKLFSLPDFAKIMPSVSSLMIKISHLICIILPQGPKSSGLSPNPLWETLMGAGGDYSIEIGGMRSEGSSLKDEANKHPLHTVSGKGIAINILELL